MDKKFRDGVDLEVALVSGLKCQAAKDIRPDAAGSETSSSFSEQQAFGRTPEVNDVQRPMGTLKKLLRPFIRVAFRALRPILAPIAFRTRHYFLHVALEEMRNINAEAAHRVAESNAALQSDLRNFSNEIASKLSLSQRALQDEMKRSQKSISVRNESFVALLDEIKSGQESIRKEIEFTKKLVLDEVYETSPLAGDISSRGNNLSKKIELLENLTSENSLQSLSATLARVENYAYLGARRVALYCGSNQMLVRTAVGYLLCSAEDHALLSSLLESGELESGTRRLIERLLQPGGTYVDVGANIGMHVIAAAHAMKGKGRIICFEPFPETAELLEKSAWINGYSEIVNVRRVAVSEKASRKFLFLGKTSGHHSLFPLESATSSTHTPVEVEVVSLDDALSGEPKVDLIKIDAEGAELEVLAGARKTITANPDIALIVEFGSSHLKRTGISVEKWIEPFQELGMRYKAIHPENGALEAIDIDYLRKSTSVNLFFARADAEVWNDANATT